MMGLSIVWALKTNSHTLMLCAGPIYSFLTKENFGFMLICEILNQIPPPYARDVAQNLKVLIADDCLTEAQKWGTFAACAYAAGSDRLVEAIEMEARQHLSEDVLNAARSAAAVMAMNNVYYRAMHLMHNQEYATLPAKLRMNVLGNPGVPKIDYELWCLAVSAINGCGLCLDSHERVLRSHGVTAVSVQFALRIAAVVNSTAVALRFLPD